MSEDIKEVTEVTEKVYTPEETESYVKKLREENKKIRLELSQKVEAEAEAKKKALEEQGKYKELYEVKEKEFSETAKTLEQLKAERDEALKVKEDFIKEQKSVYLKDLPEDHLKVADKLDLDGLKKYRELYDKSLTKTDKSMSVDKVKFPKFENNAWKAELSKLNRS